MAAEAQDEAATGPAPSGFGRVLGILCRAVALAGGVVLVALALTTVTSIVGRALFSAPIPGDFELVEIGTAVAIFAFLPYCQLRRGNVVVDLFTTRLPRGAQSLLDAVWALVFAVIAGLFAWRLWHGADDLVLYGETTMVLRLPVWWAFVPIVPSVALLAVVALYTAWRSLIEARQ